MSSKKGIPIDEIRKELSGDDSGNCGESKGFRNCGNRTKYRTYHEIRTVERNF